MSPATLFQIGSISKVSTATLAALLDEEGTLDLRHTVGQGLPRDLGALRV
jgi:CubicO group peptidase (beta-lactamase class C family)